MKYVSKTILLADDELNLTSRFQYYLESSGYRAKVYNDPPKALSEFRAGLNDLALLDVRMPYMSGFELYEKMHRIDSTCKVCFVTAVEIITDR
jgi:DNA-binding response OmpR family regulator